MTHPLLYALVSAGVVSLVSLIGLIVLPLREQSLSELTFVLISLATGALFGDAVFHLLPDIFRNAQPSQTNSFWIMGGIFSSFVLEKFLRWKHEHGIDPHDHVKPVGLIIVVSDGLHNFMDGLLVGASYLSSVHVGLATTLAVILHELPHEIGDFAVLLMAGYSRSKALLFNFLSACVAVLGVLAAFGFQAGVKNFTDIALPVTAGSFLYIAGANLTPELHKENAPARSAVQCLAILVGAGLMYALLLIER